MRTALPHLPFIRPLPLRIAAAVLILGAALTGAALLHYHVFVDHVRQDGQPDPTLFLGNIPVHPWWVDPATLAICVLGVTAFVGLLFASRPDTLE